MKDLFSTQADLYKKFRPTYPPELYDFLLSQVPGRDLTWDCGTGNGQVAAVLSAHFQRVLATDISDSQMEKAPKLDNIVYEKRAAQASGLEAGQVDLVTVGQAVHWFDLDAFYREVYRVLKPGGKLAVWTYTLPETGYPEMDNAVLRFYSETVGPFWEFERRYVETGYASLPFPFDEIPVPVFWIQTTWTAETLAGYLSSWSSVQLYLKKYGKDPVVEFMPDIQGIVGPDQSFEVRFPVFARLGVPKAGGFPGLDQ